MAGRVRRPSDKSELLAQLTEGKGRAFEYLYEVLTFSAALGYAAGERKPFKDSAEPIRWEQFQPGTDALVAMLAVASADDPEILSPGRFEERVTIFEEYANGGMEILAAELERHPMQQPREVVLQLVLDRQQPIDGDLEMSEIAEGLSG